MVILTVGLVVFLIVAGLVIDYGLKYRMRQQLQKQVDAAALAGSLDLPSFPGAKQSAAKFYALGVSDTNPPVLMTATCASGTLANGQSISITTPYTKPGSSIPPSNLVHVVASQSFNTIFARVIGIKTVRVSAAATAQAGNCTCSLDYPYTSGNPLTSVDFNESEVLAAFTTNYVSSGGAIKLWYNDEHPMTLGIRQVVVDGVVSNYTVSPLTSNPGAAMGVQVGTMAMTGDQAALDAWGRPEWPALFLTDISQDTTSRAGDWQFGGTPISPTSVFGTWIAAVKTITTDVKKGTQTITVTPDDDKTVAENHWNLGPGSDPPPAKVGGYKDEGYSAEVRWDVDDLLARGVIQRGRIYRVQFMVHDGDQHSTGGDCGEGCSIISVDESCQGGLID
jgi:hypothetical protein